MYEFTQDCLTGIDQIDEEQATGKHPEVLDGKDLNAIEDIVS